VRREAIAAVRLPSGPVRHSDLEVGLLGAVIAGMNVVAVREDS
jgi:hypothetical protein